MRRLKSTFIHYLSLTLSTFLVSSGVNNVGNSVVDSQNVAYERYVLSKCYAMLGRGSDMSLMSYNHLYVDPSTQSIHTCKNELKTSTQKQMVLLPDFECYELCHVHAEGSWWIAGGNIPEESSCFANLKASSASADLNKIIREWQETYRLEYLNQASTLKVSPNVGLYSDYSLHIGHRLSTGFNLYTGHDLHAG